MFRRRVVALAGLCLFLLHNTAGALAAYPDKPIRLVVPAAAGSALDPAARIIADALTKLLGQRVLVENREGAGDTIAFVTVAKSKPDGYTLLFATSTIAIVPSLYKDLPFDVSRDFTPITQLAGLPITLVASPSVSAKTIPEVIALAKSKPGTLSFGSGGQGTTNDLAAALLAQMADIKILRVPYRGASQAMTAVLGNEINFTFASAANTLPFTKGGQMRLIAVTTASRDPRMPDTPAIAETLPGYDVSNWYAIFGPAGLPDEVKARLTQALATIKGDPNIQKFFTSTNADLVLSSPDDLARKLQHDLALWADVIKKSNIHVKSLPNPTPIWSAPLTVDRMSELD